MDGDVFVCQIYMEIKPRLNTVHIFLQPREDTNFHVPHHTERRQQWPKSRLPLKVIATKEQIKVCTLSCAIAFKLHEIKVVPSSCHGLSLSDGTIQFRLHLESTDALLENETNPPTVDSESKLESKLQQKMVTMACKSCGMAIVADQNFSRVLPMPPDGWSDMADSWFCHVHHGEETAACTASTASLKPQDCLFNANTILMHSQMLICEAILIVGKCVKCKRCRFPLGRTAGTTNGSQLMNYSVKLSPATITFNHEECSPERLSPEYFANTLLEECHKYQTFRVVVETRRPGEQKITPFLLLWVFDTHCWIGEAAAESNSKTPCDLVPCPVVKILYKDCLEKRNSELWKSWNHDMSIHALEVQHNTSLRLMQLLASSTSRLPPFLRSLNKFNVGYLPR